MLASMLARHDDGCLHARRRRIFHSQRQPPGMGKYVLVRRPGLKPPPLRQLKFAHRQRYAKYAHWDYHQRVHRKAEPSVPKDHRDHALIPNHGAVAANYEQQQPGHQRQLCRRFAMRIHQLIRALRQCQAHVRVHLP